MDPFRENRIKIELCEILRLLIDIQILGNNAHDECENKIVRLSCQGQTRAMAALVAYKQVIFARSPYIIATALSFWPKISTSHGNC